MRTPADQTADEMREVPVRVGDVWFRNRLGGMRYVVRRGMPSLAEREVLGEMEMPYEEEYVVMWVERFGVEDMVHVGALMNNMEWCLMERDGKRVRELLPRDWNL